MLVVSVSAFEFISPSPFLLLLLLVYATVIASAVWPGIEPSWYATAWIGMGILIGGFIFLSLFGIGIYLIPSAGLIILAGAFAAASLNRDAGHKTVSSSSAELIEVNTIEHELASHLRELTPREHEVLVLIAEGKSNKEIAEALVVSPNTVRHHVHQLLRKLNCSSRHELALIVRAAALHSSSGTNAS
ncbi:MAG TPA: helix-turn-helix transcriptional regulator [Chloroflexia bacterium]|nr:helix-turn-helix transcriptional regulator [Chloroflexia bacterium]